MEDSSFSDTELLQAVENIDQLVKSSSAVAVSTSQSVLRFNDKALMTAIKHKSWLESRSTGGLVGPKLNFTFDPRMELVFTRDPTQRLAIEYQGSGGLWEDGGATGKNILSSEDDDDEVSGQTFASTPKRQRPKRRRKDKVGERSSLEEQLSDIDEDVEMDVMALGSSFITDDDSSISSGSDNKKLKMDDFEFCEGTSPDGNAGNSDTQTGDEEVFDGEGYLAAEKDGVSNQVPEMSSEIPNNALQIGSPGDGSPGGV